MAARHGLGTYGNGVGTVTPEDHKLALAGLITKQAGNLIRPGVFWGGVADLVVGKANMSYDVLPFTAALTRGAAQGAVLLANDGTVNVPTTAAPGSNSRIDVVYVWQREFALDGVNSEPVIGVKQGAPAASPVAPSLAEFPGAVELAQIRVPAGVTATNSGTTITQTAPLTAAAGGTVPFRTKAEMEAWLTAAKGQRAHVIATGDDYLSDGSGVPGMWDSVADSGVVLLSSQSFNSVASVSVNGLAGFNRYEFVLDVTGTSAALNLSMRLRSGGVDNSAASYDAQKFAKVDGSAVPASVVTQSSWAALGVGNRALHLVEGTLQGLSSARQTWMSLKALGANAADFFGTHEWEGRHRAAAAFDGFSFFTSAGTMTGTLRVYGYAD